MNQGCKLVTSTNVFVYHTERDSYFTTLILHFFFQRHHNSACQVFLQVQKPVGDLKSPLMSPAVLYLFTDLHMRTEDKADREDIFKRPAQRKPEKSNSTPQSAYPVSLAFNRMLLIASCIIFSVFKGWTGKGLQWGRIPWNVYGVLIAKCDYLKIKMNSYSPKPSSYSCELSEVKNKCKDSLLQKTSEASISVALGELQGRKWSFYWDFSET